MNNLLSIEWLSQFVNLSVTPEELAKRLSLVGAGVERIHPQGEGLDNIVVGRIISLEKHPNADTLTVCQVDVGASKQQIVCGGSNLREGMLVAVALPGSFVRWHGEGEPVAITHARLRGVESAGMICASNEIGLGEAFPAPDRVIMDLDFLGKTKPGVLLADALALRDIVFDIEATTNRPDLMSVLGVAREAVAAKCGTLKKFSPAKISSARGKLSVQVQDKKLCPRYMAVRIDGITVGRSPWWLERRLIAAGVRPINTIVDITNYIRLELGQPMHAFDAAKVEGGIVVRRAHDGEPFVALDDSTHVLSQDTLVIADASQALAVAGVMGGKESGVHATTTSVIFEAAAFDPVSVRKTARALNLYSDSQLLFEKGLSVQAPEIAMARAAELAREIAGGVVSAVADVRAGAYKPVVYPFDFNSVESFLGEKIPVAEMKRILTSLGFEMKGLRTAVSVEVPWWRDHDIESPVDFVEEIARVYGYHNLPSVLPTGALPKREADRQLAAEKQLREFFAARGFHETYVYSFSNEAQLAKSLMSNVPVVRLQNPLSSDLTLMRPSLIPGALEVVAQNEANAAAGRIFEVSSIYSPREGDTPREELRAIALSWSSDKAGADVRALKGVAQQLFDLLGIERAFDYDAEEKHPQLHPGRHVRLHKAGFDIGWLGEVHPLVLKQFGISGRVAVMDLSVGALVACSHPVKRYIPAAVFPPVKRDIAFVVDESVEYRALEESFAAFDVRLTSYELFDVFRGASVGPGKKSLAFHLHYSAPDRTLTAEEVDELHGGLIALLERDFGAAVRA